MLKVVVLLVAMVLGSNAARAAEECSSASDHAGQRSCLERLASQTASEVEAAEDAARMRIERSDEEPEYRKRSLELLEGVGRRFKEYRTTQCELAASTASGGNGAGDLRLLCEVRLNRAHTLELKELW